MDKSWMLWEWEYGGITVTETEHLFGFDLMLMREREGRLYPVCIICRQFPLTEMERRWARDWAIAWADENWGRAVNIGQSLSTESTN